MPGPAWRGRQLAQFNVPWLEFANLFRLPQKSMNRETVPGLLTDVQKKDDIADCNKRGGVLRLINFFHRCISKLYSCPGPELLDKAYDFGSPFTMSSPNAFAA